MCGQHQPNAEAVLPHRRRPVVYMSWRQLSWAPTVCPARAKAGKSPFVLTVSRDCKVTGRAGEMSEACDEDKTAST